MPNNTFQSCIAKFTFLGSILWDLEGIDRVRCAQIILQHRTYNQKPANNTTSSNGLRIPDVYREISTPNNYRVLFHSAVRRKPRLVSIQYKTEWYGIFNIGRKLGLLWGQ